VGWSFEWGNVITGIEILLVLLSANQIYWKWLLAQGLVFLLFYYRCNSIYFTRESENFSTILLKNNALCGLWAGLE